MSIVLLAALLAGAIWLYLLVAHGRFWTASERDTKQASAPALHAWPRVTVLVPARDEAELIGALVTSLLAQDYAGIFDVVIIDDQSRDGTAEIARKAALQASKPNQLSVMSGQALPIGWTGKIWALQQGLEAVSAREQPPEYFWVSDADIEYAPDTLTSLVNRAVAGKYVLTSLMAKLRCDSFAERALIPAFIFFFQMLYPFPRVNNPSDPTAAAAGGCVLAHRESLLAIGGYQAIQGALIDDCALGAAMKQQGTIWLGLTNRAFSLRPYEAFRDVRHMVTRSAYAQLRYSPLILAGTISGLILVYLVPLLLAIASHGTAHWLGLGSWALMSIAFYPTIRFYRLSPLWSLMLPVIALVYLVFTLDSAYQHWRGRGGLWKGRLQAQRNG